MSLQDNQNIYQSISCKLEFSWGGGGVWEGRGQLHNGARHGGWHVERGGSGRVTCSAQWWIGWFSSESEMTKGPRSHLTFLPLGNTRNPGLKIEKKGGWEVFTALTVFSNWPVWLLKSQVKSILFISPNIRLPPRAPKSEKMATYRWNHESRGAVEEEKFPLTSQDNFDLIHPFLGFLRTASSELVRRKKWQQW